MDDTSFLNPKKISRPTGVDILVVLNVLVGIYWFGLPMIMHPGIMADLLSFGILPLTGEICGYIFMMFGVLGFIFAAALYRGMEWARKLDHLYGVASLLTFPIGTIMSILILVMLRNSEVKLYFGSD